MEDFKQNPWKIQSTHIVHETPWIQIQHYDVLNPANNPAIYTTVNFKNKAIGIIPLDEDLNTWIVGQYRFPINEYSWEIPEGGGSFEQTSLEAAKRELEEEVGLLANKWEKFFEFNTSNSSTNEIAEIFVARELSFTQAKPEESEVLEIRKIPFSDLVKMVFNNEIKDSLTIVAVLILDRKLKEGTL